MLLGDGAPAVRDIGYSPLVTRSSAPSRIYGKYETVRPGAVQDQTLFGEIAVIEAPRTGRPRVLVPLPPGAGICLVCGWLPPAEGDVGVWAREHTRYTAHPTWYRPNAATSAQPTANHRPAGIWELTCSR